MLELNSYAWNEMASGLVACNFAFRNVGRIDFTHVYFSYFMQCIIRNKSQLPHLGLNSVKKFGIEQKIGRICAKYYVIIQYFIN